MQHAAALLPSAPSWGRPRALGHGPRRRLGLVAAEQRGPAAAVLGCEEAARGGRLGRADQVPRGVDAGEAHLAGAVGVLPAPRVVAAVPRPRHHGGRRSGRGGGVGVGGAGGRRAGVARRGGRRSRRQILLPLLFHRLACWLVGWFLGLSGWSGSEAGRGSRWEEEKGTGLWNLKCGGGAIGFREQRSPPAFLYFLVTDPGGAN
jgi:hypothetical protein